MTKSTVPAGGSGQPEIPEEITRLAREGVQGSHITRVKVIGIVRRLMMVAHHRGLRGTDLDPFLVDVENSRLARQLAYKQTQEQVFDLLAKVWAETMDTFLETQFWSVDEALNQDEAYFAANAHTLLERERRVMRIALDLGREKRMPGKTALSLRGVSALSEKTGPKISDREVGRILKKLADGGVWLSLVSHGKAGQHSKTANCYHLIPAAARLRAKGSAAQGFVPVVPTEPLVTRTLMRHQPYAARPGRPDLRVVGERGTNLMRHQPYAAESDGPPA